jgi:magnesium-transporting ATPase (P-type)
MRAFGSPKTPHTVGSGRKPGKQYASHSRRPRFACPAILLGCQIAALAVIQNRQEMHSFLRLSDPKFTHTIPRRPIFKFMIFIGPISSIFDYATYAMMLFVFDCWNNPPLFQTGWFVESLLTQTLIIHIIRTAKLPFIESRASPALITTTIVICAVGIALPFSGAGAALGFTPLPWSYWPLIAAMLMTYAVLTHLVKSWFVRRWGM